MNQRLMFEFAAQDGLQALEMDLPREQHLMLMRKTAENLDRSWTMSGRVGFAR